MLTPILHPASNTWMVGKIVNYTARPMSREEVEAHIADYERLRQESIDRHVFMEEIRGIVKEKT